MFRLNKQTLGPGVHVLDIGRGRGACNLQARIFRLLHTNSSLALGTYSAKKWSQSGLLPEANLFSSFLYCIQNTKFRGREFESSIKA